MQKILRNPQKAVKINEFSKITGQMNVEPRMNLDALPLLNVLRIVHLFVHSFNSFDEQAVLTTYRLYVNCWRYIDYIDVQGRAPGP